MIGTSIPNLAKRFFHLAALLKTKQFKHICLMGSNEDVTPFRASLEKIVKLYPEKFKKDCHIPERLTEHSAMEFFIENIEEFSKEKLPQIIKLPSSMKKLDGKVIKPTTSDELKKLNDHLEMNGMHSDNIAIISHAPFYYRQNLIFLSLANKYKIETTAPDNSLYPELNELSGSVANQQTCLDELARLFYQLQQFSVTSRDILYKNILDVSAVSTQTVSLSELISARNIDEIRKAAADLDLGRKMDAYMERWKKSDECCGHEEGSFVEKINRLLHADLDDPFTLESEYLDHLEAENRSHSINQVSLVENPSKESRIFCDSIEETIISDPITGKPIFVTSCTYQGKEIASATLYAHPIACSSRDGTRHNVLETTGVLSDIDPQPEVICADLPPSFSEIALESATQGARMGVMRGAANVFGGKNSWTSIGLFYSGYYFYRLYNNLQQNSDQDYWTTMVNAGGETIWFAGANITLSQASKLAGKVTSKLANVVGYSVYAYEGVVAWQASPTPLRTVSQLATRVVANISSGYVA